MADSDLQDQAHRLLREKWKTPDKLAEELYAMLLPGEIGPPEFSFPPPNSASSPEVAARAEKATDDLQARASRGLVREFVPRAPDIQFDRPGVPAGPAFTRPGPPDPASPFVAPTFVPPPPFLAPPFIGPPPFLDIPFLSARGPGDVSPPFDPYGVDPKPFPDPDDPILPVPNIPFGEGGGEGGGGLLGLVLSGSGDTYQVQLYTKGKNSAPDSGTVTVLVPEIDPDETIPPDTWISPIIKVTADSGSTEYYYQPPIWL